MDRKITLQDLADILAHREGLSKKEAEAFLRAFFEVVEEGLVEDRFAKIKGFGTFKVVSVSERESINVNTGERIQISGHSKVAFTPDALLRDLVNRPFAHFQTIILNDDTDIEELESVPTEESLDGMGKGEETEEKAQDPIVDISREEDHVALPPLPELPDEEEDIEAVEEAYEGYAKSQKGIREWGDGRASFLEEEKEDVAYSAVPEDVDFPSTPALEVSETREEEMPTDEALNSKKVLPHSESEEEGADEHKAPEDNVRYILREDNRTNWWKVVAFMLLGIILMALSYFAGYFRVLCPCEITPPLPAVPPSSAQAKKGDSPDVKLDTTEMSKSLEVKDAPSSTDNIIKEVNAKGDMAEEPKFDHKDKVGLQGESPAKPEAGHIDKEKTKKALREKYKITGTRQSYTIVRGETLRGIAAHVYGDRAYASYIIRYNHIKDPDNIVAGTIILLPELELNTEE